MATAAQDGPAVRRRRSPGRVLFVICLALMAFAAYLLPPHVAPLVAPNDKSLIALERGERLLRASWGLSLPGEPDLAHFNDRLSALGVHLGAPVLVRIFKREFELELWLERDGTFQRFATYPVCRWSGALGPKLEQGDGQAPEGFYQVDAGALNPNSRWYRSFNLGYPNAFDRVHNRTGSLIMVHGGCASVGCFAMTDAQMDEIWRLVTAALSAGQKRFQVQVYPFRMTDDRFSAYAAHPSLPFWRTLKRGNDLFEQTSLPPRVSVCEGAYAFTPGKSVADGDAPIEARCASGAARN